VARPQAGSYVTGCAGVCLEGFGSASFEAALAAAERDNVELVVAAVTILFHISHVSEFPLNVARMADAERQRFDLIESRLRTRLATSEVAWRLERRTGELVDVLARVVADEGAKKLFVGSGSGLSRRLHSDVAGRLRRRVRCELVEIDRVAACDGACLVTAGEDKWRTCGR
jgi:hypothetical protein